MLYIVHEKGVDTYISKITQPILTKLECFSKLEYTWFKSKTKRIYINLAHVLKAQIDHTEISNSNNITYTQVKLKSFIPNQFNRQKKGYIVAIVVW